MREFEYIEHTPGPKTMRLLLAALMGEPLTAWAEEPKDGKAPGHFTHTWYPHIEGVEGE